MGVFKKLVGGMTGGVAQTAVSAVGTITGAIFGHKGEKLSHEEIMARIAQQPQTAQQEINKIEAQHRSPLVAGWRPALGWVAAISLFFFYVPQYVVATILWVKLSWVAIGVGATTLPPYPVSADGILELVAALLGLAGFRTVEKLTGRAK